MCAAPVPGCGWHDGDAMQQMVAKETAVTQVQLLVAMDLLQVMA